LKPNADNETPSTASLEELLSVIDASLVRPLPEISGTRVASNVVNDSRLATRGSVFVAVPGASSDGRDYIPDAISAGAVAVVGEDPPSEPEDVHGALFVQVDDARLAYALLSEAFHGRPAERLRLHAVTGTNGKTTTAFLLRSILKAAGRNAALISTVERSWPGVRLDARWTTPDPSELQWTLSAALGDGCSDAVLEASSHALTQKRLGSMKFGTAVFSNLSGDHLDYHGDMESYYQAKKLLFEKHLAEGGTAVLNIDDPSGARLAREIRGKTALATFGTSKRADYVIADVATNLSGTSFALRLPDGDHITIATPLVGEFNAFNAAAALAAAVSAGIPVGTAAAALKGARGAPGRLEKVADNPLVLVDYAHTDDALRRVLKTLGRCLEAERRGGRLIVVFGCGGDRDKTKRPRMAAAAAETADAVFVTDDNPRSEPSERIIEDILSGFPDGFEPVVERDRAEAIRLAIASAETADIVLVAGKGHETYQERNGKRTHFDDRETARQAAAALNAD